MRKYSKVIVAILLCMTCLFSIKEVNAKEVYYTNKNDVALSKEEYDFFTKMYWDGYQESMTKAEYEEFVNMDFLNAEFDSKTKVFYPMQTRDTEIATPAKSLKITKLCSDNCRISVIATWLGNPTTRSYDVIGAYLDGVELQSTPNTSVVSTTETKVALNLKKQANGFGTSLLLPETGSEIKIRQSYYVSKGGRVYASYQHAMRNSTLPTSQSFNISVFGYGNVFDFYGDAKGVYDEMNGVDIDV